MINRAELKLQIKRQCDKEVASYKEMYEEALQSYKLLDLIDAIPGNLPTPAKITSDDDTITFNYPFDRPTIKEIYKQMEVYQDWHVYIDNSEEDWRKYGLDVSRSYYWKLDVTHRFRVKFLPGLDGSTCVKVKVGEKPIKVDVYELVCPDGAKEPW